MSNFGRYLLAFRPVFSETGYIAVCRYLSPNEKKKTLLVMLYIGACMHVICRCPTLFSPLIIIGVEFGTGGG
jgi:hypothetical protein